MVAHLKRNDSPVLFRRVGHDVREISIHRKQNRVYFLRFCNDESIWRLQRAEHPSDARPHRPRLEALEQLCWRCSGRPGTARPSDDGLKFSQFPRIVQARGNLVAGEIGKFSQNVCGSFARGQVPQDESGRYPGPLNPRLSAKDLRVAHDVLFPLHGHTTILSPFPNNGKSQASRVCRERGGCTSIYRFAVDC